MKKQPTLLYLDGECYQKLRKFAFENNTSMSEVVRAMLKERLEQDGQAN
jgi:hypothetical protein